VAAPGSLLPTRRQAALLVVVGTAFGLLFSIYRTLDDFARGEYGETAERFVEEMTSSYSATLLVLPLMWFARRFPVTRECLGQRLATHAAAAVAFSATLTSMRWVARTALFPLFGLGTYDYGIMPIRYAMEFPSDLIWYSIFVGFVHLFDAYRASRDREVREAQLEARLAQAQLQSLRLQLQPHFLFNTLNMISSVIYEDPRAADEMISRLGDLLRATLASSPRQEVTLEEELRLLDLYLSVMRARFDERLVVSLDVDPATRAALVPQLLLQPLVENAIRHGTDPASATATIDVRARRDGEALVLEVRDHGLGLAPDQGETVGKGIGLTNTVERLERLYGPPSGVTLRGAETGGLSVLVTIPYRTSLEAGGAA
jgi:two-component system LytT family sensor kinase